MAILFLFGWPAVICSLLFTFMGIAWRSWQLALAGAVLATPFVFYLSLTPRFGWAALLVGVFNLAVPLFLRQRRVGVAVLMVAPFVILVFSVVLAVLKSAR